jgi:hypothetical protein
MRDRTESAASVPFDGEPTVGSGRSFRRVLVAFDSSGSSGAALALGVRVGASLNGVLRLAHLRMWDLAGRGGGRVFLETSEQATEALVMALELVWSCEIEASGVIVDVSRARLAGAVNAEASEWGADVIVLPHEPGRRFSPPGLWDKVSRQVLSMTDTPVLLACARHK